MISIPERFTFAPNCQESRSRIVLTFLHVDLCVQGILKGLALKGICVEPANIVLYRLLRMTFLSWKAGLAAVAVSTLR